ncbi:MAG TPA: ABC transporter permease [Actinobacteria bacterium]|nr:ribose transport system permease protein RbsC [bacterium BMS3Bbin01]HDH25792.1 ABC transporter permease [Actinomycetota bacterium]HDL49598.1 ABC transporter permease [Actinomycetota bacterium]
MSSRTVSEPADGASRAQIAARWFSEHPLMVLSVVLVMLVLVTGAIQPNYLSVKGLRNTALVAAPLGIMAAAQMILMLTGGIDLSVAMIATGAAYVAANQSPKGAVVAILAGLLVGLLAGATNGLGVGVFRVNPLIMTLAMGAILLGLFTSWAQTIFQGSTAMGAFIRTLGGGSTLGGRLPWAVVVWAVVAVFVIYMLRRTGFGRNLYAIGDNPVATRLSGVRSWQVLLAVYSLAGLFAAIAGLLLGGRVGAVDLQLAASFMLPSVAAAVIGGTSIFGGVGTYTGTLLGALILGVLQSLFTFLGAGQDVQQVLYGVIVLGLAWLYSRVMAAA